MTRFATFIAMVTVWLATVSPLAAQTPVVTQDCFPTYLACMLEVGGWSSECLHRYLECATDIRWH